MQKKEKMKKEDEEDEEEQQQHQTAVLEQVFGHFSSDDDDNQEEEEDDHMAAVLEQVFGNSSSDEEDESEKNWEYIEEVKGLCILRNFLSISQQSRLLSSIKSEKWFTQPSINQAMRFGYQNLPKWAIKLSNSIHRSCCSSSSSSVFPPNLLQRKPFFDQMITNFYEPGEGICAHVDLLRFEDGIAIVSLESSCVMDFSLESEETVPVLLNPGSLVFMFGDARYVWKHEINRKPGFQSWQGQLLNQTTRTSVTLRKLCSSPSS
jgi:alkylated DNA repair dioxygenase AlkB